MLFRCKEENLQNSRQTEPFPLRCKVNLPRQEQVRTSEGLVNPPHTEDGMHRRLNTDLRLTQQLPNHRVGTGKVLTHTWGDGRVDGEGAI